jgi:hypothetical protein
MPPPATSPRTVGPRFAFGRAWSLPALAIACALAMNGCGKSDAPTPGAVPAKPSTPVPVVAPAAPAATDATVTSAPNPTAAPAAAPDQAREPTTAAGAIALNCTPASTADVGQYMTENNTWGSKGATGWTQCMGGVKHGKNGISAQWTWDWKYQGDNVKAYPEVVFGHKPGYPKSTTSTLPRRLASLQTIVVDYDVQTEREGAGNLAIDMWLTSVPNPNTFAAPPITHEVMIWLEVFGPMYTGGQQVDKVRINDTLYRVFVGEKFGLGWRYVAFAPNSPMKTQDSMDLMPFFVYLKGKGLITTQEYLATVNFGNEIISGAGDTKLNRFAVTVH